MAASQIDLTPAFDVTAYASLSGSQLQQLVASLAPYLDKGLIVTTTDIGGNPTVPNATTTAKWQAYLWRRITATTTGLYIWDPLAATHVTYLKWVSVTIAGIAVGSIVNAMLADNTITDVKIANLDYSKLLNAPAGSVPSGAAGGDLTGVYPNPSIGANKVTGSQIALATITHANIAAAAVEVPTDIKPSAVGLSILRTNAGATACEYAVEKITEVANPVGGDSLKIVRVKADETGFEKATIASAVVATQRVDGIALAAGSKIYDAIHSLGGIPDDVRAYLECIGADAGYVIGDEVPAENFWGTDDISQVSGFNVIKSNTKVVIIQQQEASGAQPTALFTIAKATTGGYTIGRPTVIDQTKWELKFTAMRFV